MSHAMSDDQVGFGFEDGMDKACSNLAIGSWGAEKDDSVHPSRSS